MTAISAAPASAEVIALTDDRASIRRRLLQRSARDVAEKAFARAGEYDEDGAYPAADVAALHELGLLTAVLPVKFRGAGLTGLSLSEVLRSIGSGSLPLGRLFEGHVNALELVLRYGNERRVQLVAEGAQAGKLFGVWNTDDANGLRLIHRHGRSWLEGRKILASGAGHIERPLVTATDDNGRRMIVLPKLGAPDRADVSRWTAHRMRASATGAVDFTGVEIEPMEIVGREGDYERQPWFSAFAEAGARRGRGRPRREANGSRRTEDLGESSYTELHQGKRRFPDARGDNTMARYSKSASGDVKGAMKRRKAGTLASGRSGKTVKSKKQAIAIGLSEARAKGKKVPSKKSA